MVHNITIPRPKGKPKFCGSDDVAFIIQLSTACNHVTSKFRETCDLIVLGPIAYRLVMNDFNFTSLMHRIAPVIEDKKLPPMSGYACIKSRPEETFRILNFIEHPHAKEHPFD